MPLERQEGQTLSEIRDDHLNRYRAARDFCRTHEIHRYVIDAGCGVGYGAWLLATAAIEYVFAFDKSPEAIAHAWRYFQYDKNTINYLAQGLHEADPAGAELICMFEVIEHTYCAEEFLTRASAAGVPFLIGSVPNQDRNPFDKAKHHYHIRHFTQQQLTDYLASCGWRIAYLGGQQSKTGEGSKVTCPAPDNPWFWVFVAEPIRLPLEECAPC